MKHQLSADDRRFRAEFEACTFPSTDFNHRAHVRLAYAYLTESELETGYHQMKEALFRFLRHHGTDEGKYHETLTRAWIMAVRHFLERTADASSFDDFAAQNPVMLDPAVMMTHYSAARLFSPDARAIFVEPDLDPIPRYSG